MSVIKRLSDRVAIIGVGNMGGAMARRLLSQGWAVNVCDIVSQRSGALQRLGAKVCANPGLAVRDASVSLLVVVDAQHCEEVLFGIHGVVSSARAGHTVLICPTLAPAEVTAMAARLGAAGISVIEAPMSGGPQRAEQGSMSLMLAGRADLLDQHAMLLEDLAAHRYAISEILGDASKTKLVNNLAAAVLLLGTAEALALAKALGLDQSATLDVMEKSSGQSWIGSDRMRRYLAGDRSPRAQLSLLAKDTRLALQAGAEVSFEGPLGTATRDAFERACQSGLVDEDDATLVEWLDSTAKAVGGQRA